MTEARLRIRPFESKDMPRLYHICLLTGQDGGDASGTVDDNILGAIYAAPYATFEPDLCFVLDAGGQAIGYVLGTRDSKQFADRCQREWWPPLRKKYPLLDANDQSRMASLTRSIHQGYVAPDIHNSYPAHLHIDLLPAGQGRGYGRELIMHFCETLARMKVPAVHFGVSKINEPAMGFYEHLGFHMIDSTERSVHFGMHF